MASLVIAFVKDIASWASNDFYRLSILSIHHLWIKQLWLCFKQINIMHLIMVSGDFFLLEMLYYYEWWIIMNEDACSPCVQHKTVWPYFLSSVYLKQPTFICCASEVVLCLPYSLIILSGLLSVQLKITMRVRVCVCVCVCVRTCVWVFIFAETMRCVVTCLKKLDRLLNFTQCTEVCVSYQKCNYTICTQTIRVTTNDPIIVWE